MSYRRTSIWGDLKASGGLTKPIQKQHNGFFVSQIGTKIGFEIKNKSKDRDLNSAKMHFWSKFEIPTWNQWWVITWTNSKWDKFLLSSSNWLEDLGQLPPPQKKQKKPPKNPKTKGVLTKVLCTCGPNLVILAWVIVWTSLWLIHSTNGHTGAGNENTQRPKLVPGKNQIIQMNNIPYTARYNTFIRHTM